MNVSKSGPRRHNLCAMERKKRDLCCLSLATVCLDRKTCTGNFCAACLGAGLECMKWAELWAGENMTRKWLGCCTHMCMHIEEPCLLQWAELVSVRAGGRTAALGYVCIIVCDGLTTSNTYLRKCMHKCGIPCVHRAEVMRLHPMGRQETNPLCAFNMATTLSEMEMHKLDCTPGFHRGLIHS